MPEYVVKNGEYDTLYMRVGEKIEWVYGIKFADAFGSPAEAMAAYEAAKEAMLAAAKKKLAKAAERGAVEPALPEGWMDGPREDPAGREYRIGSSAKSLVSLKSLDRARDPLAFFCPKWLSQVLRGYSKSGAAGVESRAGKIDLRDEFNICYAKGPRGFLSSEGRGCWTPSILLAKGFGTPEEAKIALLDAKSAGYVVGARLAPDFIERVGAGLGFESDAECEGVAAQIEARQMQAALGEAPAPAKKAKRM